MQIETLQWAAHSLEMACPQTALAQQLLKATTGTSVVLPLLQGG